MEGGGGGGWGGELLVSNNYRTLSSPSHLRTEGLNMWAIGHFIEGWGEMGAGGGWA